MSGSEYSDVTDYDDAPSRRGKNSGGKGAQKGAYKIRNVLKVPRATTYTAQALYDQIHSSDINLEPEYQRNVVWPESKQIGIIDSIFRNFYIPPVIFAVNSSDDGSETKTCIDGKQRLTSIHRFMDGLIPHKDPHTSEKLWYKDVANGPRARKILPEKYRRLFANKQVVCVEYQDITDGDEREIFQRVQLGMALTPAEKLQVTIGPRAAFIRQLQSTYLKDDGLEEGLNWDSTRGGDFRCLAQAVFTIEKYPAQKNAGTVSKLEKWLSQEEPLSPELTESIHSAYRVFLHLVRDKQLNTVFQKHSKVAPIEFIMISLLIAQYKDKFSPAQLSSAIDLMRDDVRKEHVDIRMNNYVAKTMLDFVKGLKASQLKGAASGEPAASLVGQKRKRETEDTMPKAKKSPRDTPNSKPPSSSSKPSRAPSTSSATETYSKSAPSSVAAAYNNSFVPTTDRLAAVRAAKEAAPALRSIPSGPASLRGIYSPTLTPTATTSRTPFSFANGDPRMMRPPSNALEESLMAPGTFTNNRDMSGMDYPPRPNADDRWEHHERERDPRDSWDRDREERYRREQEQRERERQRNNYAGGPNRGSPDSAWPDHRGKNGRG